MDYRTKSGEVLSTASVSRHHVNWREKDYQTPLERRFRRAAGMILKLENVGHCELHANVEPPIKPNPHLMHSIIEHTEHDKHSSPYEIFYGVMSLLKKVELIGGYNALEAGELYNNYYDQLFYIESSRVEVVRDE